MSLSIIFAVPIMFYIPILIIVIYFLYLLYRAERRLLYSDVNTCFDNAELTTALKKFSDDYRDVERCGKGVTPVSDGSVARAYALIKRKAKKTELFECERWLLDNRYAVRRYCQRLSGLTFEDLPHAQGVPRVIALANLLCSYSGAVVTAERVEFALNNLSFELHYSEVAAIENATAYILLKKIEACSRRVLHFNRLYIVGLPLGAAVSKLLRSESFANLFPKRSEKMRNKFSKFELTDKLKFHRAYATLIAETNVVAENSVKSLHGLSESVSDVFAFYSVGKILENDATFAACDKDSKLLYFEKIAVLSDKLNYSESKLAEKTVELAAKHDIDVSVLLFRHGEELGAYCKNGIINPLKTAERITPAAKLFIGVKCALTVFVGSAVGVMLGLFAVGLPFWADAVCAILSAVAFLPCANRLLILTFSNYLEQSKLPAIAVENLRKDFSIICVKPVFISSISQFNSVYEAFLSIRAVNLDPRIEFILLVDLPSADSESDELSEQLSAECSLCDGITVMLRARTFDGSRYSARERKRGAVEDMNRAFTSGDFSCFDVFGGKPERVDYVVVIDDDSVIEPRAVLDAVRVMEHPLNNYGLLNFANRCKLSSIKTAFSKKYISCAGRTPYYPDADFYFRLSGQSLFSGKGIYRLNDFVAAVDGIIPSGRVLSHDILEGGLLSTGCAPVSVYEDVPENLAVETKRNERWLRGDVQLLPFTGRSFFGKLTPFTAYVILQNGLSFFPLFALFCLEILAVYLYSLPLVVLFLSIPLFSCIIDSLDVLLCGMNNCRMSVLFGRVFQRMTGFFQDILLLPFRAVNNFFTALDAFRRIISKKNLLSWRTFAQTRGEGDYLFMFVKPLVVTALLIVLAAFVNPVGVLLFGAIILAAVLVVSLLILLGAEKTEESRCGEEERARLKEFAEATYAFFCDNKTNGLICDNFQEDYDAGAAALTSPTNIGFSLVAELSAVAIGIIDADTAVARLGEILSAVEKLPKWHGHLYNWYSLNGEVLQDGFVSSVDSGNFVACLIAAKEYLSAVRSEFSVAAEKIIAETDFESLYDKERRLFYVGRSEGKEPCGHYDLLASEARLLSLTAVALGLEPVHWNALSREHTPLLGNTLYSWSGTAFEYLMSDLFVSPPPASALGRTSAHAVSWQTRKKCGGLFGISESAYYSFDANLRLQYKAFGLSELALRADTPKCVISPYSSFLMLKKSHRKVIKNLNKEVSLGLFGKYGFYDSVDFTGGEPKVAKCYMAHHHGMSLAAVANFLADNAVSSLYSKNRNVDGASVLLSELPPCSRGERKRAEKFECEVTTPELPPRFFNKPYLFPQCEVLNGNDFAACFNDFGEEFACSRGRDTWRFQKNLLEPQGAFLLASEDGKVISPTFSPLKNNDTEYLVTFDRRCVKYENKTDGLEVEIFCPEHVRGEIRRYRVLPDATGKKRKLRLVFFGELQADYRAGYAAHPNFRDMFTSAERRGNAVIYTKRGLHKNEKAYFVLLSSDSDYNAVCDKETLFGLHGDFRKPLPLFADVDERTGDILAPAAGMWCDVEVTDKPFTWEITAFFADNDEELEKSLLRAKNQNALITSKTQKIPMKGLDKHKLSPAGHAYFCSLVPKLLYIPFSSECLARADADELDELSFFTDGFTRKILYVKYTVGSALVAEASKMLALADRLGLGLSLVICYEEADEYLTSTKNGIAAELRYGTVNKNVFLTKEDRSAFAFAVLDEDYTTLNMSEYADNFRCAEMLPTDLDFSAFIGADNGFYPCGNGGFSGDAYYVNPNGIGDYLPYSNVIAGKRGGTVVSTCGGFTYFGNSNQGKVTSHSFDYVFDKPSERIYVEEDEGCLRLNDASKTVCEHRPGLTRHHFRIPIEADNRENSESENTPFMARGYLDEYLVFDGAAKVFETTFFDDGKHRLFFFADLELGSAQKSDYLVYNLLRDDLLSVVNMQNCQNVYLKTFGGRFILNGNECLSRVTGGLSAFGGGFYYPVCGAFFPEVEGKAFVVMGADLESVDLKLSVIEREKAKLSETNALSRPISVDSQLVSIDRLFNDWLPSQIRSCRLLARAGFYQAGGAFGFRDQLQDSLALLTSEPGEVRNMLLLMAAHQYEEGDVQHWWHGEKTGVRTKITDDRLFLPYVTACYIEATGDDNILWENVPYLASPMLGETEESRYETPDTGKSDTLYGHLIAAFDSLVVGAHSLLLIGGGDWNDAINEAGTSRRGESVWLTMFYCMTMKKMLPWLSSESRLKATERIEKFSAAIEECWDGDRYRRLLTKNGNWVGGRCCDIGLDLLTQAFSSLCGVCDKELVNTALTTAKTLIDKDNRLIRLLDSPSSGEWLGYINAYPSGVRENGGQYTHAAVWYALGLIRADRIDEAAEILRFLNPVDICSTPEGAKKYKGEPYVLAADVYSNPQYPGRAGWTWYTGSAGWYYQAVLELFGFYVKNGKLVIHGRLPSLTDSVSIEFRWKNAVYKIRLVRVSSPYFKVNGLKVEGCDSLDLKDDGVYNLEIGVSL